MKLDWRNGKWLDGPRTADWLEEFLKRRGETNSVKNLEHGDATLRALHRWRYEGANPSIYVLDRILTAVGAHVSDIPDDLWIKRNHRKIGGQNAYPEELRQRILEEAARTGAPSPYLSQRYGVAANTINTWKREAA